MKEVSQLPLTPVQAFEQASSMNVRKFLEFERSAANPDHNFIRRKQDGELAKTMQEVLFSDLDHKRLAEYRQIEADYIAAHIPFRSDIFQ